MSVMAVGIELVLADLAAQGIAVNAKDSGGAGLVAVGAVQDAPDEAFLEFPDGFIKKYSALHHLIDKPFQLIFHDSTLRSKRMV
jgi:hypothetical protein